MSVGRYQSQAQTILDFTSTSVVPPPSKHVLSVSTTTRQPLDNYLSTTLVSTEHHGGETTSTTTSRSSLSENRTDSRLVLRGVELYFTWAAKELLEEEDLLVSFNIA